MVADKNWVALMRFMAREICDLAIQQHPEVNPDDNQRISDHVINLLNLFDMNEVLKTEVKTILGTE